MARHCTVCDSPHRREIDRCLVEGTSRLGVANRYGLAETSVRRHVESHLPARLRRAAEVSRTTESRSLRDRIESIVSHLEQMGEVAKASGDRKAYVEMARELLRALELQGKVSGEIQAGVHVTVAIQQALGVPLDVAKAALERAQEADAAAPEEIAQRAVEFLTWFRDRHPAEFARLDLPVARALPHDAGPHGRNRI